MAGEGFIDSVIPVDTKLRPVAANYVYRNSQWVAWDGFAEVPGDYKISDTDTAADTKYYGYVHSDGSWYIMKEVTSAESFRYARGTSDYSTAWTGRAGQSYGYYDTIF